VSVSKAKQLSFNDFDHLSGDLLADEIPTIDKYEREYIIAILLGPTKEPDRFIGWPPHMTVVPWFCIDNVDEAIAVLQKVSVISRAFKINIAKPDLFGPRHTVPVLRVNAIELEQVHNILLGELENIGAEFVAPQYMGPNFNPHITIKQNMPIQSGNVIEINKLWLIEATSYEDRRTRLKKVIAEVELQS